MVTRRLAGCMLGAVVTLLLTGCASNYSSAVALDPYRFFSSLWHGLISPFSIAANIISRVCRIFGFSVFENVQIIWRPNTGFFYYIGLIFGLFYYGGAGSTYTFKATI